MRARYFVVQPYGTGRNRENYHQATVLSTHATAKEAFAAVEDLAGRLQDQSVDDAAFTVVVVDVARRPVPRAVN